MSYSDSFPTQRPSLNLVFNGGSDQLDSRISYTRSSSGTAFSSERHLSSENTQTNSDSLSDWTGQTATLAGSQVGPDGTTTNAAILTGTAGTGIKGIWEGLQNIEQTISWYAKEGTHRYIQLYVTGDGSKFVNFDLNGAGAVSANGSGVTASITASSNGYLRCAVNLTIPDTYVYITLQDSASAARAASTSSTGTVYLFGIQSTTLGDATNVAAYVATGSQIHREFAPTLKTSAANEPRFEYDPITNNAEGLLIESQATNKATYSEDFTNAVYNKYRATIESASAIAPDGTLTASFLREDATASNTHYLNAVTATGLSVGTTKYAVSIFVKAAGRSKIKIYDNNQNTSGSTTFDLSNGTVVTGDGSIKSCGNGWFRCTIIPTANYSATSSVYMLLDNGSGTSYTGDNFSGILVWGYQLETGVSASSSYIKSNSGSSTTRSADSCSVVDATLFSSGEHTVIWEGDTDKCGDDPNVDKRFFSLSDTTTSNRLTVDYNDGTQVRLRNWADGNNDVAITYNADVTSGTHKVAATLKTNEAQLVVDGTRRQVDTSCVVGTGIQRLGVNTAFADAYQQYNMNGHCKRITYFNVALSQTEVEALTSNP